MKDLHLNNVIVHEVTKTYLRIEIKDEAEIEEPGTEERVPLKAIISGDAQHTGNSGSLVVAAWYAENHLRRYYKGVSQ